MSLRDDVERLLPGWESWYPSLFHAAEDLGLIRARVCSPGSLMISQRHAKVYSEAVQAFRVQWSAEESEGDAQVLPFKGKRDKHKRGHGRVEVARNNPPDAMPLMSEGEDALDYVRNDANPTEMDTNADDFSEDMSDDVDE